MRRSSTAGILVRVPTPLRKDSTPHSLSTSSSLANISRLERSAEAMSQSGSDLGEEIRRIASASSWQQRSRQNSIQSSRNGEIDVVRPGMGERYGSQSSGLGGYSRRSSRAGSRARYVSPGNGGYVGSPIGSVQAGLERDASMRSGRLESVSEPTQEGRPLDSPMSSRFPQDVQEGDPDDASSRQVSSTSFGRRYDEIAGNIRDSLVEMVSSSPVQHNEGERRQSHHLEIEGTATPPDRPRSTDTYQELQSAFKDFDGVHFSPETDELIEVDENGNEVRRVSARNTSGTLSEEAASLLRTPRARPTSYVEPPPGDDMVYYPAPVPRMLNLPKRLSKLPANSVQAKRRSQMLAELPKEARAAAPWLPPVNFGDDDRPASAHSRDASSESQKPPPAQKNRMSHMSGAGGRYSNLPPQLRASAFFDHPAARQEVEVQGESAVATLESILAASATAPVTAFTDHPYMGDVRKSVYAAEVQKARNTSGSTIEASPKSDKKKRRSSIGNFFKRSSSGDQLGKQLDKRASRASLGTELGGEKTGKLQKRKSTLSMGDELDRPQTQGSYDRNGAQTPDTSNGLIAGAQNADPSDSPVDKRKSLAPTVALEDDDQIQQDFAELKRDDDGEEAVPEEGEPMFVQPSTLLAELQVRKAQLKSRNRTAVTAYPTGMHSTLLQLDAVEEINKRKRQKQRIALAWEDPHQRALEEEGGEADEDVPLGVLFPGQEGRSARKMGDGKDWDRPLGLMEKREMEDNEPLSRRRNRLQGGDTGRVRQPSPHRRPGTGLGLNTPQLQQEGQAEVLVGKPDEGGEEESEHEGETLGQRMRRMRAKEALDGTIAHIEGEGDVSKRKSGFSEEWASQFGNLDVNGKEGEKDAALGTAKTPSPNLSQGENEEETLGQRRARLQREAAAGGGSRNASGGDGANRPALHNSASVANLLASNPAGERPMPNARTHTAPQGTLLHSSAERQAKAKSQLQNMNLRSSSYGLNRPLVNNSSPKQQQQQGRQADAMGTQRGMLGNTDWHSRAPAGGFGGGMYSNGAGGANVQAMGAYQGQNQRQGMAMGGGGMPMVNTPGGNGFFASPTAGYFSQQQQQQARPQMMSAYGSYGFPQQQQYAQQQMGGYGYPAHYAPQPPQNPYAMPGWQGNASNPGMMGGTYAAFAQTGRLPGEEGFMGEGGGAGNGPGVGGTGGGGVGGAPGGGAIERWRMGVAGQ